MAHDYVREDRAEELTRLLGELEALPDEKAKELLTDA
jgi:hypothetical protein